MQPSNNMVCSRVLLLCLLSLACTAVLCIDEPMENELEAADRLQWLKFKRDFSREFSSSADEQMRFSRFRASLRVIEAHNSLKSVSWRMGINHMADWTAEELAQLRIPQHTAANPSETVVVEKHLPREPPPTSIDWRALNAVTPVVTQGQCGSPWVWSVIGSIEGLYEIATGKLTAFSGGQLLDCTTPWGNFGCNGGYPSAAFTYLFNHTLANATACPYVPVSGKCHCNQYNGAVSLKYFVTLPAGDETSMLRVNGLIGPLSVTVNANSAWQYYSGGIMTSTDAGECPSDQLNHCVTAVGYGTEGGVDFWIFKNSWGTDWGESGYIRIQRGFNICGLAESTMFPILDIIY